MGMSQMKPIELLSSTLCVSFDISKVVVDVAIG